MQILISSICNIDIMDKGNLCRVAFDMIDRLRKRYKIIDNYNGAEGQVIWRPLTHQELRLQLGLVRLGLQGSKTTSEPCRAAS
jgi:hypothetical protein